MNKEVRRQGDAMCWVGGGGASQDIRRHFHLRSMKVRTANKGQRKVFGFNLFNRDKRSEIHSNLHEQDN